MQIKVALAHVTDSRNVFSLKREPAVKEEIHSLKWLSEEYEVIESDVLNTIADIANFCRKGDVLWSTIAHYPYPNLG